MMLDDERKSGSIHPWLFYRSGLKVYDAVFSPVLDKPIEEIVHDSSGMVVLDAFSETTFLRELARASTPKFLGGVALGLADVPLGEIADECKKFGIQQINGDIYTRTEWMESVNNFLHTHHRNGFDIITCRPEGAFALTNARGEHEEMPLKLRWLAANALWQLVDIGGRLFMDFAIKRRISPFGQWKDRLNKMGIIATNESSDGWQGPFELIKRVQSPTYLPPLS